MNKNPTSNQVHYNVMHHFGKCLLPYVFKKYQEYFKRKNCQAYQNIQTVTAEIAKHPHPSLKHETEN